MLFADVAATSTRVAATSARSVKRDEVAELLRQLASDEVEPVVGFLVGQPWQGRIGVGWRTLTATTHEPAAVPSLSIGDADRCITALQGLSGPGSGAAKQQVITDFMTAATADEASFFVRLIGGDLRQGASEGVMIEAIAAAWSIPGAAVRRAVMLGGRLDTVASAAAGEGLDGVAAIGLELGRPLQPMLASTASSVGEAVEAIGSASVEWKLDGIRIQVHRRGDEVRVWTRNLNEITDRVPGVVAAVRTLPVDRVVLDGEALVLSDDGRPKLFQDTASHRDPGDGADPDSYESGLRPYFFDVLHVDGVDLVDRPLQDRAAELERIAGQWRVRSAITDDPEAGAAVLVDALAAGHEGVVVKSTASTYEAGRRGKAWRKVKPVHTFDLVVLGVEWGHGRRTGWLSNLHLGARADDGSGFVMVGKTFKGLTDELLRWQTERFLELAVDGPSAAEPPTGEGDHAVMVRPEQVVEVAIDGVQRSTRYPGGVALRFARVVRYRDDKDADEADPLSSLTTMLGT